MYSYNLPRLWPVCEVYTLGPLIWVVRREWLRRARSDTNPTHLSPSVVAHSATTLTMFVAVSDRINRLPAPVMAVLQLI